MKPQVPRSDPKTSKINGDRATMNPSQMGTTKVSFTVMVILPTPNKDEHKYIVQWRPRNNSKHSTLRIITIYKDSQCRPPGPPPLMKASSPFPSCILKWQESISLNPPCSKIWYYQKGEVWNRIRGSLQGVEATPPTTVQDEINAGPRQLAYGQD